MILLIFMLLGILRGMRVFTNLLIGRNDKQITDRFIKDKMSVRHLFQNIEKEPINEFHTQFLMDGGSEMS